MKVTTTQLVCNSTNKLSYQQAEHRTQTKRSDIHARGPYQSLQLFEFMHHFEFITYKDVKIKQYSKVTYLGCVLDECLTGGSMAMQVCTKVTSKLNFLYRKNRFFSKDLRKLHFD